MKSLSLFLAGLTLVILPSFVLASHPTGSSTVQGVDQPTCESGAIPGAQWATSAGATHLGVCWLPGAGSGTTIGGALGLVNKITNWLVAFLIIFGVFYGIMGAYEFLSSGGEDKKLTAGKKKIYYAVGGVALGLLVKGIIALLVNFVGTLGGA